MKATTVRRRTRTGSAAQPRLREEIIRRAAALFEQKGYRAVSVDAIAEEIGISKPTFYAYLDSKVKILWEIYAQLAVDATKFVQSIRASSDSPRDKLRALIRGHMQNLAMQREFYAVYFQEEAELPRRLQTKYRAVHHDYQQMVEEVFRQAIEEGTFPRVDPRIAALGLLGMCNWATRWYSPKGPLSPDEIADTFFAMLAGPPSVGST